MAKSKVKSNIAKQQIIILAIIIIVAFIGVIGLVALQTRDHDNNLTINEASNIADHTGIDWSGYTTYDVELRESLRITTPGIYRLSGKIADGNITIETDDNVKLILDGVSIKNSSGPAIFVKDAKNVVIFTTLNTTNTVEDGSKYVGYEDNEVGAIFSHDDLFLDGEGILKVQANNEDGIVSKDDLVILGGAYEIDSLDDGIRGKDSVQISSGDFTIKSGGKGIKSSNETDEDKGYIQIQDGTFNLITTDDALHAIDITIDGGDFTIESGDDGMHADDNLVINNGKIAITKSYEGLEGTTVTINDGEISVVASDDGINAAGSDDTGDMGRPGPDQFRSSSKDDTYIRINGGNITVDASGDGVDSNSNFYIDGGKLIVYGPTNSADAALDYDGELKMTGGVVLAGGASGMTQGISESSTIYGVTIFFSSNLNAKSTVTIKDDTGKEIASYVSTKSFGSLIIASPEFKKDQTYTIKVNDETYQEFTISSISTQVGNGGFGGGMMRGDMPGGMQPNGAGGAAPNNFPRRMQR